MKKFVLLLLSVWIALSSFAQDTITESDTCYFFWPHSYILHAAHNGVLDVAGTYIWETILPSDTWIYGISVRGDFPMDSTVKVWILDTLKDGTVIKSDTVYIDSYTVNRYFKCRPTYSDLHNYFNDTIDFVDKCNEVYFHRPWLMRDTFYVYIETSGRSCPVRALTTSAWDTIFQQRWSYLYGGSFRPFRPFRIGEFSFWGHEFSILEPDRTRCGTPRGLHFTSRGGNWAVLAWNSGSGDSYRVTLEGPDSTVVAETSDTTLQLQNLVPDSLYYVYVQSMCRYQYRDFDSTFVNPGRARMGFRNISNGIDSLDFDLHIELRPNPASRVVEVTSSSPENHIEVYDEKGRQVYKRMIPNYRATLDVSAWSRGLYLLHITTGAGKVVKKLLLQ